MNSFLIYKLFEESILFFCKDSKIKINIDNKYYNLEDFKDSIDLDQLFLTLNNAQVILEKDVTIGNIVNSLNIFGDNITLLTGIDFDQYHKMNNQVSPNDGHFFDTICIGHSFCYMDDHKKSLSIGNHNIKPSSSFSIENNLDSYGLSNRNSFSPTQSILKIRNVPVKLKKQTKVFVNAYTGDIEKEIGNDIESKLCSIEKICNKGENILFFDFINTIFKDIFFYITPKTIEEDDDSMSLLNLRLKNIKELSSKNNDNS